MTLAEGVLDGSAESLSKAKLKRGNDPNLARLSQYISEAPAPSATPSPKPPPSDPALAFADRAASVLGQSLIHCQEAILPGESSPVVLTVLRDASRAAAVSALFHETEWRGNAPRLHVLDEPTWQSLQRLAKIGLITFNTRATRHLSGDQPPPLPKPALTPEQIQRITDLRAFAAKKQKVAQLLIAEGLEEEAAPHREASQRALNEAHFIETFEADDIPF